MCLWTPEFRVRLVPLEPLNMFKSSSIFSLRTVSKRCFFCGSFCYLCLPLLQYLVCFLQFCDHLLGKSCLIVSLVYDVSCVLSLSHMVSKVRCGTWLYQFMIFAFFLTLSYCLLVKYILFITNHWFCHLSDPSDWCIQDHFTKTFIEGKKIFIIKDPCHITAQVLNRIQIFTEIEHTCFPIDCLNIDIPTSSSP